MTTTVPPRSLELPPVALSARPLRLDLPRFQLAPTTRPMPPSPEPAPLPSATTAPAQLAPLRALEPAPSPERVAVPASASAPSPAIATAPVELPPPTSIAPVIATPSLTRRDGTIGLAIDILVVTLVLAAALAMQRSMHGWPPGMH
jgi:hypothetical protein